MLLPTSTAWRNQLFSLDCPPHDILRQSGHLWPQEECRGVSHEVLALRRFRSQINSAPSWKTWSTAAGGRTTKASGPPSSYRLRTGREPGMWPRRCGSATRRSGSGACAGPLPPPSWRPRRRRPMKRPCAASSSRSDATRLAVDGRPH